MDKATSARQLLSSDMTDNTAQLRQKLKTYNWSSDKDYQLACIAFSKLFADYISQLKLPKLLTHEQALDSNWLTEEADAYNQALTDTTAILAKAVAELRK